MNLTIRNINEYLAGLQSDNMNDYYPPALWLDTDTGTYGDAKTCVVIDVTNWSDEDISEWENMTDSERQGYGTDYAEISHSYGTTPDLTPPPTPTQYMRGIGR